MECVAASGTLANTKDRFLAHQGLPRLDSPAWQVEKADAVAESLVYAGWVLDSAEGFIVEKYREALASFRGVAIQSESVDL